MDDFPVHGGLPAGETRLDVARAILRAFKDAGVPEVYGFVNGARMNEEPGLDRMLQAWRAAGYPLGNHGWAHRNLDQLTAAQFEDELAKNEPVLARYGRGADWHWFRYPFLAEGGDPARRDAARAILARRGYRIAQVSMSYADYEFADAYLRCRAKGDAAGMAEFDATYMIAVKSALDRARTAAWAAYGRDVPYVVLTHVGAMNARMMPKVLDLYRKAGFRFVTLAEAERDPVYAADLNPAAAVGNTRTEAAAAAAAFGLPPRYNPAPVLNRICR
jgi:peptidoglycan/xylan/chitin deacetylase (PgdA/CDA1 family)